MISEIDRKVLDLTENELYKMAVGFLDDEYIGFKMTTSQIKGIENVLASTDDTEELKRFLRHQADKANREDETKFFNHLRSQVDKEMNILVKGAFPKMTKNEKKEVRSRLVAGYIQHLVCHHYYITGR